MTDASLRRADELLSELIELVETARALPMSSSCVVPREQVLDLLDALRETMPPEMAEARTVVARQQAIEADARAAAEDLLNQARSEGDRIVHAARVEAHESAEAARAEANALVSASSVHAAATMEAQRLRQDAEEYSERMRADARTYADRTLADLAALLGEAARTAENGRQALRERIDGEPPAQSDQGHSEQRHGEHWPADQDRGARESSAPESSAPESSAPESSAPESSAPGATSDLPADIVEPDPADGPNRTSLGRIRPID